VPFPMLKLAAHVRAIFGIATRCNEGLPASDAGKWLVSMALALFSLIACVAEAALTVAPIIKTGDVASGTGLACVGHCVNR
jgi:hypothetical protein